MESVSFLFFYRRLKSIFLPSRSDVFLPFLQRKAFFFPFFSFLLPLPVIRRDERNKAKKVSEVEFDFPQELSKHIGWYFPST